MLSFSPTILLRSVDFPTLGFPTTVTIPAFGITQDTPESAWPKKKARSQRCERGFNWGRRTRTSNFLINSQAVCQLTYTPIPTFDQSKPFPRRRECHWGQQKRPSVRD